MNKSNIDWRGRGGPLKRKRNKTNENKHVYYVYTCVYTHIYIHTAT